MIGLFQNSAGHVAFVLKRDSSRRCLLAWLTLFTLAIEGFTFAGDSGTLTNLAQVRALTLADGARAIPVKARGVVTYCDPIRRTLFIQDRSASISVQAGTGQSGPNFELQAGQLIELEGVTARGQRQCSVRASSLKILGSEPMPAPVQLKIEEVLNEEFLNRWVKVTGYIPNLVRYGARLSLRLVLKPGLDVELTVWGGDSPGARDLAGSLVEVSGVLTLRYDSAGKIAGSRIFAPNPSALRKIKSLPVTPLAEIGGLKTEGPSREPVRLRGTVLDHNLGEYILLRDGSGIFRLPFGDLTYFNSGRQIEAFAWPIQLKPELVLTNVFVKAMVAAASVEEPLVEILTPGGANTNLTTLEKVAQIRKLSAQEASRGFPVRLSAVVTYCNLSRYLHFVQDESAGIYVDLSRLDPKPQVRSGQKVQIVGFSGPGDYAPLIVAQQVNITGEAPLPPAQPVTLEKMMSGSYDSQWVSVSGVVRHQWLATNLTMLGLYMGDAEVKINVTEAPGSPAPMNQVDSAVEIEGVCATLYDEHRRLQGVEIHVPGWAQVRVTEPAVGDPFTLPVKSVASLLQFTPGSGDLHRTRLMGIATLTLREGSFYLQDASGGILVQPQILASVPSGSAVEVIGFPNFEDKHLVLQNGIVRTIKSTHTLEPAELKPESLLDEGLHGTLVRCEGQVLGHFSRANQEWLTFQLGASIIDVILEKNQSAVSLEQIKPGSVVRLTGVYLARRDSAGNLKGFELRLPSERDVRVLSRPSWWTVQHTLLVLALLLAMLILGLGWVRALSLQVAQRTLELNEEIEHHKRTEAKLEAEIAERKRMQSEVQRTHQELLEASRQAGMAEVATSVLHNVGNVLNSVNVSVHLLDERLKSSKISTLAKVCVLLRQHSSGFAEFLTNDPRGRQVPRFISQVSDHLQSEQRILLSEVESLEKNLDHIKRIVATQQAYARVLGVVENLQPADLVEDALRINEQSLAQHQIRVLREYSPGTPKIVVDKHKVLQVIVNLIRNARNACQESGQPDKRLTVRVFNGEGKLKISISDNGVGIAPENLTRIFSHGFTTRKDGHGFGLHSGALAAKEMGGLLRVHSEGAGQGATFTLELPIKA